MHWCPLLLTVGPDGDLLVHLVSVLLQVVDLAPLGDHQVGCEALAGQKQTG